jgi:streptogramin lyase
MATRFTRSIAKGIASSAFALVAGCGGSTNDAQGPITLALLAGSPTAETFGSVDSTGVSARFNFPTGVASDSSGTVYVADAGNNTIRKITPDAVVVTFVGTAPVSGSIDGIGAAARFNNPFGVARDSSGNLFVADTGNHTIRKITPAGAVTTFAGTAGAFGATDGIGAMARFYLPTGVAVDSLGNVFVADFNNRTVRKIDPSGLVTTFAGAPGNNTGSVDGIGGAARFNTPTGIAVDGSNNLYVTDSNDSTVRKITPDGTVTTLAGAAGLFGSADGIGPAARFEGPYGVAADTAGNVYVADDRNRSIRKVTPAGAVTTVVGQSAAASVFAPGLLPGSLAPRVVGVAVGGSTLYITTSNAVAQIANFP